MPRLNGSLRTSAPACSAICAVRSAEPSSMTATTAPGSAERISATTRATLRSSLNEGTRTRRLRPASNSSTGNGNALTASKATGGQCRCAFGRPSRFRRVHHNSLTNVAAPRCRAFTVLAVRAPKLLAVVSAIDLEFKYGCTLPWWQIWKGLHEAGVDLIVTPYRGDAILSPWWRVEPNPCRREGELYAAARTAAARLRGDTHIRRAEASPGESRSDRIAREVILRYVNPRWQRHLERILER